MTTNHQRESCCDINAVIKEHYGPLFGFIRKRVSDGPTAEDLVQEVMYRAAKAHSERAEVANPRAWLYQTARHVIADHFRQQSPTIQHLPDLAAHDHPVDLPEAPALSDGMVQLIKLLPQEYALPLLWSDIDHISHAEIARRLDIGLSAAKMRVQRARKKLHDLFLRCCEIEYDRRGGIADCTVKSSCAPLLRIEAELRRSVGH
ncbi:sigma-70 family RNA polymerase sigma factor [Parapedobacter deserti]|uniref:Sigma-70 family RNA polymerase sigma factor n=1 Tax=Parapedobacter deserti TaxID=1912957 RepID=A0ABV7JSI0_9SPHI